MNPEHRETLEEFLESDKAKWLRSVRPDATTSLSASTLLLIEVVLEQADRIRELESHER